MYYILYLIYYILLVIYYIFHILSYFFTIFTPLNFSRCLFKHQPPIQQKTAGEFFHCPIFQTDQHGLHEVCDSGTLAGSALPSCQALPCNFSWPGPKVCLGLDQLGGLVGGVLKGGVTNQVPRFFRGLSWLGSDRFELCMGSRNFHNFLELSWSTRILISRFFCATAEKLL